VQALTLDELAGEAAAFDAAVMASDDIDRFCSSTDWILPAATALMPLRDPWLRRGERGFVALMRAQHPVGAVLEPLEAMWGLACPVVGPDPVGLAAELAGALDGRTPLLVCGLARESLRFSSLARALAPRHQLRLGPVTRRWVASLDGGLDGFLGRRSANFRHALKRTLRRAVERGITVEPVPVSVDGVGPAYARLLAVEARSWKGESGVGLGVPAMEAFYRHMLPRLAARGALRLAFARRDGEDLAYILGGLFGDTYRGLQFSFVDGYADCSLGNLSQYHQIAALCDEGLARYDLGAEVEYKRRWGEIAHETVALIALPLP
jgi:hypothetical protein